MFSYEPAVGLSPSIYFQAVSLDNKDNFQWITCQIEISDKFSINGFVNLNNPIAIELPELKVGNT
jgi:hypothetical protein